MNIEISRRAFLKGAGAGVGATALGALGFSEAEATDLYLLFGCLWHYPLFERINERRHCESYPR